ncbi:hypothetical protein SAMN05216345_108180 [Cupriavidus sp. YR651]|uniref:hypothetical protein n=1 Tax=Cupriavidus sp. YR651 TaxID=1855315 RepID=UPI00088DAA58|nr:hypothetical protein [Cupriavidus sp. YR651]SDD38077.1 hypothetical protein SAMN05216345_108180 [Cupriavidus sp. YR651]
MPRVIETFRRILPEEGIVIRSRQLHADQGARALIHEARRRARGIVEQAEENALTLRQSAVSHGHLEGLRRAAGMLVEYLCMHGEIVDHWKERMRCELRAVLEQALARPEVLLSAVEQAMAGQSLADEHRVEVLLPRSMTLDENLVRERLTAHGANLSIHIRSWDGQDLLLRAGDHVTEIAVGGFIDRAVRLTLDRLSPIHAACAQLADEYRARMAGVFLDAPAVDAGLAAGPLLEKHDDLHSLAEPDA